MRTLFVSALVVSALATPQLASAQSGYTQKQWGGFVKLAYNTITSNNLYTVQGDLLDNGSDFTQHNVRFYGELGVTDYLTVGLTAPVLRLNAFETSDTAAGFGDLELFAKAGTELFGIHGALQVNVELPTGRSEALTPTEFDTNINLPTGDGETNVWFRLALSRSIPSPDWMSAYASVYTGLNVRTGFTNQAEVGGEIGAQFFEWVWVQTRIRSLHRLAAIEDLDTAGTFLFGEGTEFVSGGVEISGRIPATPLWLSFEVSNTFANLENLYAGTTWGFGLWTTF